jgi:hypothetical protein
MTSTVGKLVMEADHIIVSPVMMDQQGSYLMICFGDGKRYFKLVNITFYEYDDPKTSYRWIVEALEEMRKRRPEVEVMTCNRADHMHRVIAAIYPGQQSARLLANMDAGRPFDDS